MIDGSEKRNRQLAFELQNSHVCEKRSNVWKISQRNKLNRKACTRICRPFFWRHFAGATALPVRILLLLKQMISLKYGCSEKNMNCKLKLRSKGFCPKRSLRLKGPKALWRKRHYPRTSMHLK